MGYGRAGGIRSAARIVLRGHSRADALFQCMAQCVVDIPTGEPRADGYAQIDNRDSFENVGSKWISEINDNCPGVRVVLTALKCDLRKDEEMNDNPDAVTFAQGLAKAKEIGAVKYLGTWWPSLPSE